MARQKFDLAALMGAEAVSNLDTMQVEEIELDHIRGNEDNFFEVDDVDALADSIALIGLQQPLVVMREGLKMDGKMGYILIAGHRRMKALQQLDRRSAPCIVQSPPTGEFETLALIQTNTTARSLDYPARMEAVKRTEAALMALKEKGYDLPGRMRDRVAEITQEKASEIARMKVIDKNLSAPLRQALTDGTINASTAYELARLDTEGQEHFAEIIEKTHYLFAGEVARYRVVRDAAPWRVVQCPARDFDHACDDYRVSEIAKCREKMDVSCCHECQEKKTCKNVCYHAKNYRTPEQRAKEDAEREAIKKANYDADLAEFEALPGSCLPKRLHAALRLNNMSVKKLADSVEEMVGDDIYIDIPSEDTVCIDDLPISCILAAICRTLDVSADWLLGLTDDNIAQVSHQYPEDRPYKTSINLALLGWHQYPEERPEDGQTVLTCIYSRSIEDFKYLALVYRSDGWYNPKMPDCQMSVDVRWWSAELAPAEEGEKS